MIMTLSGISQGIHTPSATASAITPQQCTTSSGPATALRARNGAQSSGAKSCCGAMRGAAGMTQSTVLFDNGQKTGDPDEKLG